MIRFLLVIAVAGLLLVSCSSLTERQERAERILDTATNAVQNGIEDISDIQNNLQKSISGATQQIQATATDLQHRAEKLQNGVAKLTDAVEQGQDAVDEVQGSLNVSGE